MKKNEASRSVTTRANERDESAKFLLSTIPPKLPVHLKAPPRTQKSYWVKPIPRFLRPTILRRKKLLDRGRRSFEPSEPNLSPTLGRCLPSEFGKPISELKMPQ